MGSSQVPGLDIGIWAGVCAEDGGPLLGLGTWAPGGVSAEEKQA